MAGWRLDAGIGPQVACEFAVDGIEVVFEGLVKLDPKPKVVIPGFPTFTVDFREEFPNRAFIAGFGGRRIFVHALRLLLFCSRCDHLPRSPTM